MKKIIISFLFLFFILPTSFCIKTVLQGSIDKTNSCEKSYSRAVLNASYSFTVKDIAKQTSSFVVIKDKLSDCEREITILNGNTKECLSMSLHDYIICAVAGEMPATFEAEALKAQAVAARTFTVSHIASPGHGNAVVCTNSTCCQAFVSVEQMKKNWGNEFDAKYEKIKRAVEETDSLIMTYEGLPIKVFYFSTSNGYTEACSDVFVQNLPYYKSVISEGEETAPRYYSTKEMKASEFLQLLSSNFGIECDDVSELEISIDYTDGQRVDYITINNTLIRGTKFRSAFGLRSADFHITFTDGEVLIEIYGNGHGCGMSQLGAEIMAENGSTFEDIIFHYYIGVSIDEYSF